jgi:hypothetical protein
MEKVIKKVILWIDLVLQVLMWFLVFVGFAIDNSVE